MEPVALKHSGPARVWVYLTPALRLGLRLVLPCLPAGVGQTSTDRAIHLNREQSSAARKRTSGLERLVMSTYLPVSVAKINDRC